MNPNERKRLRELAEKATPGPWTTERPFLSMGIMDVSGVIPSANLHPEEPYKVETTYTHGTKSYSKAVAVPSHGIVKDKSDAANNMDFIAAARTAVPQLLDLVEELEAENGDFMNATRDANIKVACLEQALEKIADPRKRDHREPDAATELGCVMHIANEALQKLRGEEK